MLFLTVSLHQALNECGEGLGGGDDIHACLMSDVMITCDCVFPVCGLQGLFRVAPSASKLKKLKASLDCGVLDVQEYSSDPHAIAGELHPR